MGWRWGGRSVGTLCTFLHNFFINLKLLQKEKKNNNFIYHSSGFNVIQYFQDPFYLPSFAETKAGRGFKHGKEDGGVEQGR